MSLVTSINTSPINKRRARQIARSVTEQCGLRVVLERCESTFWLRSTCKCFAFPDVHNMQADDVDPGALILKMDTAKLPVLAAAIREIAAQLQADFTFYIAWVGDGKLRTESMDLEQFLMLIKNNEIGNRVEYTISNR